MAEEAVSALGKPLQAIPWSEKTQDWYKKNGQYLISKSNFNFARDWNGQAGGRKDLRLFYEVYNNQFPLEWFDSVTNPLSAVDEKNKKYPAKIRPVTILRTNIDLLAGEYPRRPFVYNVENLGEAGYNQYMSDLNNKVHDNLTQHFIQQAIVAQQEQTGQELTKEQTDYLQKNPPLPEEIKTDFEMTYKDALAVKGQKWLKRVLREYGIKKKFQKMFLDWLIAGQCYSYKGIRNGRLEYRKVPTTSIDSDASTESEYVEDGDWVVCRRMLSVADVVDEFYSVLKEKDIKDLESGYNWTTPDAFYSSLSGLYTNGEYGGKIPVFHAQWKGLKRIKIISYFSEEAMNFVEEEVDEDFNEKSIPGARAEIIWKPEVYEVERIGKDLYVNGQAVACQRLDVNGTKAKLSYNGKRYSNNHAENISVLELGLPFQIMYIITTFILEKTIAKSKGKIMLIDANAIPGGEGKEGWDEERFFYWADAQGYMLLDRNQQGVDKSWNQYSVLDMSLFDQIKQLIELKESFKQEWDDIIGISRQRKGQTYASDAVGNNERATFQSTVITDMIFSGFEEFTETELQGIMELGSFMTAHGIKSTYQDDDFGTMLMEIAPEDFSNANFAVYVDSSAEHLRKLEKMENMAQAMLQNNAKPSTMMEVIDTINAAELKAKLKRIEAIEQDIASSQAQSEQEHEQAMQEIQQRYAEYNSLLKIKEINAEYDRKEDLEYIKGSFQTFNAKDQDGDKDNNGTPDAVDVMKLNQDREKTMMDFQNKQADRTQRDKEIALKEADLQQKMKMHKDNLAVKNKQVKVAAKKAAQRPKAKA